MSNFKIVTGREVIEELLVKGKPFAKYYKSFNWETMTVMYYMKNHRLATESRYDYLEVDVRNLGIEQMLKSEFVIIPPSRIPEWSNYEGKYENPFEIGDIVVWTKEHTDNDEERIKWGYKQVIAIEGDYIRYKNKHGRTGENSIDHASHFRHADEQEKCAFLKNMLKSMESQQGVRLPQNAHCVGAIVKDVYCRKYEVVHVATSNNDILYGLIDTAGDATYSYHDELFPVEINEAEYWAQRIKNLKETKTA